MNKQEAVSIPYRVHVIPPVQNQDGSNSGVNQVSIPYRVHVMRLFRVFLAVTANIIVFQFLIGFM